MLRSVCFAVCVSAVVAYLVHSGLESACYVERREWISLEDGRPVGGYPSVVDATTSPLAETSVWWVDSLV